MQWFSFGFFHDEVVDVAFEAVVGFISCRADSKPVFSRAVSLIVEMGSGKLGFAIPCSRSVLETFQHAAVFAYHFDEQGVTGFCGLLRVAVHGRAAFLAKVAPLGSSFPEQVSPTFNAGRMIVLG